MTIIRRSMSVNIICLDSNPKALRRLVQQTKRLVPDAAVYGYQDPDEVITRTAHEGCDVLLTDTDLGRANTDGFILAEKIQKLNPFVNIIFLTEHADGKYGYEAYKLRASGYLIKPYSLESLAEEFTHLRYAAK